MAVLSTAIWSCIYFTAVDTNSLHWVAFASSAGHLRLDVCNKSRCITQWIILLYFLLLALVVPQFEHYWLSHCNPSCCIFSHDFIGHQWLCYVSKAPFVLIRIWLTLEWLFYHHHHFIVAELCTAAAVASRKLVARDLLHFWIFKRLFFRKMMRLGSVPPFSTNRS